MSEFTHIDSRGIVRMVDVSQKAPSLRTAVAGGYVTMQPDTLSKIKDQTVKKGNVLETARIAGILAAKKTPELIPMCHPIQIRHVQVDFFPEPDNHSIEIQASVRAFDQTGVEMEALRITVAFAAFLDLPLVEIDAVEGIDAGQPSRKPLEDLAIARSDLDEADGSFSELREKPDEVLGDDRPYCGDRRAPVRFSLVENDLPLSTRWRAPAPPLDPAP